MLQEFVTLAYWVAMLCVLDLTLQNTCNIKNNTSPFWEILPLNSSRSKWEKKNHQCLCKCYLQMSKKYILTLARIQEIHGLLCKSSLYSKPSFLKFYLNSCYQNKELNCFNNWTEKVNSIGLELTNESRNWTIGITSNSKENSQSIYLNNDF